MRRFKELYEMATPSDSHREKMYYHGTSDDDAAQNILKTGHLSPPDEEGLKKKYGSLKGNFTSVKGKVYVTPHLRYAQIYGLGGDTAGSEFGAKHLEKKSKSGYGYIFASHGKHLKDIDPDEDSVGEFIGKHYKQGEYDRQTGKVPFVFHNPSGEDDLDKRRVAHNIRSGMTDHQFHKSMQGYLSQQASGGKRALKKLSDHDKLKLIDWGAHVAHTGPLPITKAWRIHHSKVHLLKRDGSNFHDHAEEIPIGDAK